MKKRHLTRSLLAGAIALIGTCFSTMAQTNAIYLPMNPTTYYSALAAQFAAANSAAFATALTNYIAAGPGIAISHGGGNTNIITATSSGGTVTSIAVAADGAGVISWSGSPVTSSGTFTPTFATATSSQFGVIKVDGTTITASGGTISVGSILTNSLVSTNPGSINNITNFTAVGSGIAIVRNGSTNIISSTSSGGTVTSVAAAADAAGVVSWSGSPITSSGTLTPTFAQATSGQFGVIKVDGTTITAASGIISAGSILTNSLVSTNPGSINNITNFTAVGSGIAIVRNGSTNIISSTSSGTVTSVAAASDSAGVVSWSGSPITGAGSLTPSFAAATSSQFGVVKVDGTTITAAGGVITSLGGGIALQNGFGTNTTINNPTFTNSTTYGAATNTGTLNVNGFLTNGGGITAPTIFATNQISISPTNILTPLGHIGTNAGSGTAQITTYDTNYFNPSNGIVKFRCGPVISANASQATYVSNSWILSVGSGTNYCEDVFITGVAGNNTNLSSCFLAPCVVDFTNAPAIGYGVPAGATSGGTWGGAIHNPSGFTVTANSTGWAFEWAAGQANQYFYFDGQIFFHTP